MSTGRCACMHTKVRKQCTLNAHMYTHKFVQQSYKLRHTPTANVQENCLNKYQRSKFSDFEQNVHGL